MTDEEIILFCIKHSVKVEQFYFMWLVVRKDFTKTYKNSYAKQYLKECGSFKKEDIQDLVDRGFVEDFNSPGQSLPEMYMIREDLVKEFHADESYGEELWNAYPATFPLGNGGSFMARAGDKDDVILLYLKKIRNNPKKHQFVMEKLNTYKERVKQGKINGHKISDWIAAEMWDSIEETKKEVTFGRDI